jgi:neutral ceramidase
MAHMIVNTVVGTARPPRCASRAIGCIVWLMFYMTLVGGANIASGGTFKAGCSVVDISPRVLPAIRNGGFLEESLNRVDDPLHARCLVLSDGAVTLAIAIVDSCMVPREVCDKIKQRVERDTHIAASRILIAATHTHSAPSLMDYCLGSRQDPAYVDFFIPQVAAGIAQAHAALEPAQAGWTVASAPQHTYSRRWLHRADKTSADPFGQQTVRAMMHPGYMNLDYLGPSGPVDPRLTLLAIRSHDGRPISVLANFSMHYFGSGAGFSADYFGDFARYLEGSLGPSAAGSRPFAAIMSQGTSGDLHWMDYAKPKRESYTREQYARELGDIALRAIASVSYRSDVDLAMAETRLTLSRRLPTPARLRWAQEIDERRHGQRPKNLPEVYAEQALWIQDHRSAELVLQAVRIGEGGMAAIPNEVFAITGLKLKAQSPLAPLMNLELANGAEGYIPPPEQHYLGGYTTWPARTAGLETEAEPKIVAELLSLLEQVSRGAKRRPLTEEFYTAEQRLVIDRAQRDDNNRENRGEAPP